MDEIVSLNGKQMRVVSTAEVGVVNAETLFPSPSRKKAQSFQPITHEAQGTLMKTITLHPLVIVVEGFYASASEIRRTWDTSPCDGTGNGRLPDIP
jgi:hypothetical protein